MTETKHSKIVKTVYSNTITVQCPKCGNTHELNEPTKNLEEIDLLCWKCLLNKCRELIKTEGTINRIKKKVNQTHIRDRGGD